MNQDATWYGGRPRPRRLYVGWDPAAPSPKRGQSPPPIFGPCLLSPNGWMDQDETWRAGTAVGLILGHIVLDGTHLPLL